jgi:hypothetical protein
MTEKEAKKADPLRMKTSEFDAMMRHALGVKPEPTKKKPAKKKAQKK